MLEITAYVCEHCGNISKHKPYMKGHEKQCLMNPTNAACKSCTYWFKNNREWANPDDPLRDFDKDPLPFCDNPHDDYSIEKEWIDSYGCIEVHTVRKNCVGYEAHVK